MDQPDNFSISDDHAVFRPSGQVSLDQAVQLITSAITFAQEQRIRKLLVITTGLTGFVPPDTTDRSRFAKEWAYAARGAVRIAVVARPEMIDPQKFGVTVAANHGLTADVFASETEAVSWLLSPQENPRPSPEKS